MADIFNDCFGPCAGVENDGNVGPICGWLYNIDRGASGSTVTFSPGNVLFEVPSDLFRAVITKDIAAAFPTIYGSTTKLFLTQLNVNSVYEIIVGSAINYVFISFEASGQVTVDIGDAVAETRYQGTWDPHLGAREVILVIDGSGVPTMTMDGVNIPIPLNGSFPGSAYLLQAITLIYLPGSNAPSSGSVQKIFVATGDQSEKTFCCPS